MGFLARHVRARTLPVRILNVWLSLLLLLSLATFSTAALQSPEEVFAQPSLSVSASVGDVLLGGATRLSVDVTNQGDAKGYNLSLVVVLSSSLADPDGVARVTGGSPTPTSISFDPITGDTTVEIFDVVDLAPTESHTVTLDLDISGDPSWEVGDFVVTDVTAEVNDIPDSSGTWRQGTDSDQGQVIPIDLVAKSANQSTAIHQASGTLARAYSYTLEIQNNYVNPTYSVVVTDTVPDGVEFLGQSAGPALDVGFPWRDPATGETHLQWTLEPTVPGRVVPGENVIITYDTGIRYDYFGTDNGGNNRAHDVFDGREATSTPVPHKADFANTARLDSAYKGSLPATITPTDSDSAVVTGAYVTIDKAGSPSVGGYGTVVDYTLTYATSEYYSADQLTLTDVIGDGLSYVPGSASIPPDTITNNPDGTTVLQWLPSTLGTIGPAAQNVITLQASMDATWQASPLTGQPIRAGDSMTNGASLAADWQDLVNPPRNGNDTLVAEVSAGISTRLPGIYKDVWDPDANAGAGGWADALDAQVGDEILYRLRFNTTDGATPERSDITLGHITLTDWIPPGTSVSQVGTPTVSSWTDFSDTTTPTVRSVNPTMPVGVSIGSLSGIEWFLGDVAADGWWETTFTAMVDDDVAVADGLKTGNHWKLTGINSFGQEYSDRDIVDLTYTEPDLTIDKSTASVPNPLVPSSAVTYTITVDNVGTGDAGDLLVTDILPVGMRATAPTVAAASIDGGPALVLDADYKTSWDSGTGTLAIDFYDATAPAVGTALPTGSQMLITVAAVIDGDVGAGRQLTNTASVTWDSQLDGSGRSYGPAQDTASVTLSEPTIDKVTYPGPIRIGDTIDSTITVTVPAGAIMYWPEIRDRVTRDGAYYVPASTTISDVSGTPVEGARLDTATPEPSRNAAGSPRTIFTWLLANRIDNRGQTTDYVFDLSFTLQYTGEDGSAFEMNPPTATDAVRNNRVWIYWGYSQTAARSTDDNATRLVNRDTQVDQPILQLDKSVGSPGPYAGSQVATYTSVISNPVGSSWNTAYDLDWEDVLDTYLGSPALQSVTHSSLGDISGSVTADFSLPPTLTIDFGAVSLDVGEDITVVYTVVVDPNVPAAAVQTNTADVDWSSMPGTPAGSRRYDDQTWEDWHTGDTDVESIAIAQPTITKRVFSPPELAPGALVTTVMTITVPPETVLPGTAISDALAIDGFVPISFTATSVSGAPQLPAMAVNPPIFDTTPSPGTNILFPLLTDIDNADPAPVIGDTPYVFAIVTTGVYTGVADDGSWEAPPPQTVIPIDDTARLGWMVGGVPVSITATASVDADQPVLSLAKSVVTPGPYEGGDPVVYQSVFTNIGDATAYRVTWEDLLPAEMSTATFGGASHSILGDISTIITADFSSASTVTADFTAAPIPPGASIAVTYTVDIDPGAGAGSVQTNTADVDWYSQPAMTFGERAYIDSAEETWVADTDTAAIQIDLPDLTKTVESGIATRTVGEEFSFYVDFSIPASTTAYNVSVIDSVPDGLSVVGTSILSGPGAVAVGAKDPVSGVTPVVWTVGTVTNPPDITLSLEVIASVDETFTSDGSRVSGLVPQDTFENSATIVWDDAVIGGTTRTRSANATVTAVEPELAISKTASEASLDAGEETTYTVTIENVGTSTAYEVEWGDVIPTELFSAGMSPSLAEIRLDGMPLSSPAEYTYDMGSTPSSTVDLLVPMPVGSSLEIEYAATLNGGAASGISLVNTASVTYASLPATSAARFYGPVVANETVLTRGPVLSVSKDTTGDLHLQEGDETEFTVTVTNAGDGVAYSVEVIDTLPPGFTYVTGSASAAWSGTGSSTADPAISAPVLSWDFAGSAYLDPADALTLTFRARVDTSTASGTYTNHAVSGAVDGGGTPVPTQEDSSTVDVTQPAVSVDKELAPGQDPFVQVGETITYEITVTNSGDTTLSTVPLAEEFDPAYVSFTNAVPTPDATTVATVTWNDITGPGVLGVGSSAVVTLTVTAVGNPPTSSTADTVTVSGATDVWGDTADDATDTARAGITAPGLTIDKSLASGQAATVSLGDTITFDIVLTNSGDTTLTTAPVSDTFDPAVLAYSSASPSVDTTAAGSVSWTDVLSSADLEPGQSTTITVTFQTLASSALTTNTASSAGATDLNGDSTPPASESATATVVEPELTILKTVSTATLEPGEVATYTVTIENTGTGPAEGVVFTDRVPDELYDAGSSPTLLAVLLDSVPLAPLQYVADFSSSATATAQLLVPIPAGSTLALVYEVELEGGHPSGLTLANDASVTYSSMPGSVPGEGIYGPVSDSVDITTRAPELAVTKTSIGDSQLQAGQDATYRVVITNTGDAPAYGVTVIDTLPPDMSYVPGSTSATWSSGSSSTADPVVAAGAALWTFGGMAYLEPSDDLVLDYSMSVGASPALGVKTNSVDVAGADGGGVPLPSVNATEQVLVTDPSAAVDKRLAPGQDPFVQVGESVTFEIVVTNDGSTAIDVLPLEDAYDPTYLSFVTATPSIDTTAAGTLGWTDITGAGSLAVGESTTLTVSFTAVGHPPTSSTINAATVLTGTDEYGDPVPSVSDTAPISITEPLVSVDKRLAAGQSSAVLLGEEATFSIVVTNSGDTTLTTVPLTDSFDESVMRFVSSSPTPTTEATGSVSWSDLTDSFGDLVPGQAVTVTVQFELLAETAATTDTAQVPGATDVNGDPTPSASSEATVAAFDPGSIDFVKTADPPDGTIMLPDDVITYSVTVTNNSPAVLPEMSIVDTVAAQAAYVPESMTLVRGGPASSLTDAPDADEGALVGVDPEPRVVFSLGDLAAGESVTASFRVAVREAQISRVGIANSATLATGDRALDVAGPVFHPVDPFDIFKTGTDVNGGRLEAGDEILWEIEVVNTGLVPTTNTVIRDTVPAETTYVRGSMTGPGADESGAPDLVWMIGDIPVGGSVTVTFRSTVNPGLPTGTQIRNQATVEADQSPLKYSDFPETPEIGDATLLTTGGNDVIWIVSALLAMLAGVVALLESRRLRRSRARASARRAARTAARGV